MAPRVRPNASKCEHLERPHYARGFCKVCFQRSRKIVRPKLVKIKNTSLPDYYRNRHLLRTYGITKDQQDAMFLAQNGKCAICKTTMTSTKPHTGTSLAVDHDHATGFVRGLLCHFCNIGIGAFKDNVDFLESAKTYIKEKSCLQV